MKEAKESESAAPEMVSTVAPKNVRFSEQDNNNNNNNEQGQNLTPMQASRLLRRMKRRLFLDAVAAAEDPLKAAPRAQEPNDAEEPNKKDAIPLHVTAKSYNNN